MATDQEIVKGMNDYMRARGFTCGRNFVSIGDLARGMISAVPPPGETISTLEPKIRRLSQTTGYGFKTKDDSVSASDATDDECGS